MKSKSLIELRGIAQSLNIPDIFQKDQVQLIQAIELKQQGFMPKPEAAIPHVIIVDKAKDTTDTNAIKNMLEPFIQRGLHLSFDATRWYMKHGKRTDEGTLTMPLRVVLRCAEKIFA